MMNEVDDGRNAEMKVIRILEKLKMGLLILMISSFIIFNLSPFSSISVIFFAILQFLVYIIQKRGRINLVFTNYQKMVLLFAIYCFASAMWADEGMLAISKAVTIVANVLCMTLIFWCFQDNENSAPMMSCVMWSGVIVTIYAMFYYGVSEFFSMATGAVRMGNDFANANTIGIWSAISIILFVYAVIHNRWHFKYTFVIFPIILLAMSQSRTALAVLVCGVFFVFLLRFYDKKSLSNSIIKILLFGIVLIVVIFIASQLEIFGGVKERIESFLSYLRGEKVYEGSIGERVAYLIEGWKQFIKTPILGVGIGNTGKIAQAATGNYTYLHNNYIELLAGGGLIGFLLYYRIIVYLIVKLLPYALNKNVQAGECLVILAIQIVTDFGGVLYYDKGTYLIFMICFFCLYQLKKHENRECSD